MLGQQAMKQEKRKRNRENLWKKDWFFEKINKIDTFRTKLNRNAGRKTVNSLNDSSYTTRDFMGIKQTIRKYYENLYINKLNNSADMDKCL